MPTRGLDVRWDREEALMPLPRLAVCWRGSHPDWYLQRQAGNVPEADQENQRSVKGLSHNKFGLIFYQYSYFKPIQYPIQTFLAFEFLVLPNFKQH